MGLLWNIITIISLSLSIQWCYGDPERGVVRSTPDTENKLDKRCPVMNGQKKSWYSDSWPNTHTHTQEEEQDR